MFSNEHSSDSESVDINQLVANQKDNYDEELGMALSKSLFEEEQKKKLPKHVQLIYNEKLKELIEKYYKE